MSRGGPGRASKPPRGRRATTRSLRAPTPTSSCWRTTPTTRPKRSCCSCCAARDRRGLAAMPRHRARDAAGPALLRPLLDLPRATLDAYANARGLAWIDDESNADRRHKRNLLRLDVAPLLAAGVSRLPVGARARGRATRPRPRPCSTSSPRQDARRHASDGLDRARACRAVRRPARAICCAGSCAARACGRRRPRGLPRCLRNCRRAGADARTRIVHDGAEIGCHRGRVVVHARGRRPVRSRAGAAKARSSFPAARLRFERTHGGGIAAAKFDAAARDAALAPRRRTPPARGEPAAAGGQEASATTRGCRSGSAQALPLIWCGDELAAVPGIGVALAFQARPGEAGWRVDWRPE